MKRIKNYELIEQLYNLLETESLEESSTPILLDSVQPVVDMHVLDGRLESQQELTSATNGVFSFTCPDGERWRLAQMYGYRANSGTIDCHIDTTVASFKLQATVTGTEAWFYPANENYILTPGDLLKISMGAGTSGVLIGQVVYVKEHI